MPQQILYITILYLTHTNKVILYRNVIRIGIFLVFAIGFLETVNVVKVD